jgi:hypothetical protein
MAVSGVWFWSWLLSVWMFLAAMVIILLIGVELLSSYPSLWLVDVVLCSDQWLILILKIFLLPFPPMVPSTRVACGGPPSGEPSRVFSPAVRS